MIWRIVLALAVAGGLWSASSLWSMLSRSAPVQPEPVASVEPPPAPADAPPAPPPPEPSPAQEPSSEPPAAAPPPPPQPIIAAPTPRPPPGPIGDYDYGPAMTEHPSVDMAVDYLQRRAPRGTGGQLCVINATGVARADGAFMAQYWHTWSAVVLLAGNAVSNGTRGVALVAYVPSAPRTSCVLAGQIWPLGPYGRIPPFDHGPLIAAAESAVSLGATLGPGRMPVGQDHRAYQR